MFKDVITLKLKAGKGGDGAATFHREKFVPLGGPSGGRGGNGGSVIFIGDKSLNNLYRISSFKEIKAENGENGKSSNCYGKNGENAILKVPLGTIVKTLDDKYILEVVAEKEYVICHGGRGGRGNVSFKSSRNQAPDFAEKGRRGEELEVKLELKMIAEIGLLGLPNSGKSTFLKMTTNANPKIANYPFTTLRPNLGVINNYEKQVIIADIPGIIEGANVGLGLGLKFLRHIERCRIFIHIIEATEESLKNYNTIRNELKLYSPDLLDRPEIIFINKIDEADDTLKEKLEKDFKKHKNVIIGSNFYPETIKKLTDIAVTVLKDAPTIEIKDYINKYYKSEKEGIQVYHENDIFYIKGEIIENYFHQVDFNKEDSVLKFSYRLKVLGVEDKLRELGINDGDTCDVLGYEFIFNE